MSSPSAVDINPSLFSKISDDDLPRPPKKRARAKKVSFEPVGMQNACKVDVALELAEKHESAPSALKKSRFRTNIDMGSMATANMDMLELFHATFNHLEQSDLRSVISEEFYTIDQQDSDGQRNCILASQTLTNADLAWHKWRSEETKTKFIDFQWSVMTLIGRICRLYWIRRDFERSNSVPSVPGSTEQSNTSESLLELPGTKLVRPSRQANRSLMTIEDSILINLGSPIRWPRGRTVELDESPQRFQCRLPDNETMRPDRITVVMDGAFCVRTKTNIPDGTKVNPTFKKWLRQGAALGIEHKNINPTYLHFCKGSTTDDLSIFIERTHAEYILTTMLGMAFIVRFTSVSASIYWATFTQSYLSTVQTGLANLSESVHLHYTKQYSLFDTDERTEFLRHFMAVVRFISEGKANVGFLRRDMEDNPIHLQDQSDKEKDRQDDAEEAESAAEKYGPPQQVLDIQEFEDWIAKDSRHYEA